MLVKDTFVASWITLLFVFILLTLGLLFSNYKKQISQLFKSLFFKNIVNQLIRDDNGISKRILLGFNITYFLSLSLFVYFLMNIYYSINIKFLEIAAISFSVYLVKYFVIKTLGFILKLSAISAEYSYTVFTLNVFNLLFLFPFVVVLFYTNNQVVANVLIYSSVILFFASFIFRILKLTQSISLYKGVSILYLFFYICTLEISPLLIGGKILNLEGKLF